MLDDVFQVGDRVVYSGFSTPEYGTVFNVHVEIPPDSPDGKERRTYDIGLDAGGSLINTDRHLKRAP